MPGLLPLNIFVRMMSRSRSVFVLLLAAFSVHAAAGSADARQAADAPAGAALRDGLPLEPQRVFSRVLTEGSWLSVDVHPTGGAIAFDLLGSLFELSIEGGSARRLTHGMAFDAQPRYSPDGTRIAFVSDRGGGENVWILSRDLADTLQLTHGKHHRYESPAWTPDGEHIIVTRWAGWSESSELWIYAAAGGSGVPLTGPGDDLQLLGAAITPDARHVWYAQRTTPWWQIGHQFQLATLDRASGETRIETFRHGGAFRPTLSPDGRWLVYGSRHVGETGLRLRDLATGSERWLAFPVQRDEQESRATRDVLPGMAITPDSRELVATYGGGIWRVPLDGSEPTQITFEAPVDIPLGPEVRFTRRIPDSTEFVVGQIRYATPSPAGDGLAFAALHRLYVLDQRADGAVEPRLLADPGGTLHHPVWSPDGRWIAFVSWRFDEHGHVYRVRSDGSAPPVRLTTEPALYQQLAWAPDGRRIVAIRGPARAFLERSPHAFQVMGGARELVWLPAAGGSATIIAPIGNLRRPHFTSEGDRIYASSAADGLVSMRWDGSDRIEHLRITGEPTPGHGEPRRASIIIIAPDGRNVVAQVGEMPWEMDGHLYHAAMPPAAAETPILSLADPATAAVPARRLTTIGAQFPAWNGDGRAVHWSLGNAHFVYDLDAANDAAAGSYEAVERRIVIRGERDMPRGVVVLRGGRAITMAGDEILEDADIVIRDNRILAVGSRGAVPVPDGARVIDIAGTTVVPGFIDTHAHVWPSMEIHRDQVWPYVVNLAYGVTTVRDAQSGGTDFLTYADMVRAGRILGPRIYSTGPGILPRENITSLDVARSVLRRYADYYRTNTVKQYNLGNREQRQWIIQAARELQLMPTTEAANDAKVNLTQVIDGYAGQEHSLPGFPHYADVVALFAESGIAYTPTIVVGYGGPQADNHFFATEDVLGNEKLRRFTPFEDIQRRALRRHQAFDGWFHPAVHVFRDHAAFARDVLAAGGRVAVGSHGDLQGLGYHWELWALQSGGMSHHDALRAATLLGAEAIGRQLDLGSIEAGKLADLVILARDPLDDIRHTDSIRFVMRNGRLYDGDTLDELWPRSRPAGPFYWQEELPPRPAAGIR